MHSDKRTGEGSAERELPAGGSSVARACALLSVSLGAAVLASYWAGLTVQTPLWPGYAAMKPNTALCVLLLGWALLAVRRGPESVRHGRLALAGCALAALTMALSLLQLLVEAELGIDQLLTGFPAPTRMPPITAGALLCLSLALAISSVGARQTRAYQGLLALAALLALLPALGYLYRAPLFYQAGAVTSVAPLTVLCLLALLLGCLAARVDEGMWPLLVGSTPGSALMRRALPAVLGLPVLFGWLRLQAEHYAQLPVAVGAGLMTAMTVVSFVSLLLWAANRLRAQDLERRVAVAGLQNARDTLEARVDDRTRVLKQTDVELRRSASQLTEAKEAAEAAMRARADFLARMSHEMRTPLNGVVGMLEIALRSELAPAQRDYVLTARTSAESLLSLINDILDFSKIDAGKLSLSAMPFRLRDCVGTALRESAHAAHQKGLELFMTAARDVPDCLVGDPQRLRQVISNLVSNAVKFTSHGEIRVEIAADRRGHGSVALSVTVSDTGVGVPADKQTEIFLAFAQADESTTRRFGGTGLGLAVSAQLVQLMGGQIGVESAEGEGSRFFFTLGLAVDEEAELARSSASGSCVGLRALLIEPHHAHRELLCELLQAAGLASVVCTPQDALGVLDEAESKGQGFALLIAADECLSDQQDFLPALRRRLGESWPVVLLTRATPPDGARQDRLVLASAQLTKPVVATDLLETIQGLLFQGKLEPEPLPITGDMAPLNVLLAEDNEVNRRVASFLLQDAGYNVVAVENGREALAAIGENRFDVVLMDGHMPEMDGIEATRQLRAREKGTGHRTPIIALTAQAMKGDRERYLAAGMDAYLTKPFQAAQLLSTLREVVGRSPPESLRKARGNRRFLAGSRPSAGSLRPSDAALRSVPPAPDVALVTPAAAPLRARPAMLAVYAREGLLNRLRGQEGVLRTMVGILDEEAADMLAALSLKVDEGDAAGVEQSAHKLAGALLTVGAERSAATARMLEAGGRAGDLPDAQRLRDNLRDDLRELRQAFLTAGDLPETPPSAL